MEKGSGGVRGERERGCGASLPWQVGRHLMATYERVNSALEADKSIDSSLSGTTAVTAIVRLEGGGRVMEGGDGGRPAWEEWRFPLSIHPVDYGPAAP